MKIAVIGAGLAGSMITALLSLLHREFNFSGDNLSLYLFEKRDDPRIPFDTQSDKSCDKNECSNDERLSRTAFGASVSATKRSINLALSYRGMKALREVGMLDEVMTAAIAMPGRVIHSRNGNTMKQAYGKPEEAIYSVGRQALNYKLLDTLSALSTVTINFNHSLIDVYPDGSCTFLNDQGNRVSYKFDLIIGADGAYSATRESLLKKARVSFSRSYISHGYKELSIPPRISPDGKTYEYALEDHNGLHIWPRGRFMMIALPNPDKSFTATLFAPYKGEDGFDSIGVSQHGSNNTDISMNQEIFNYFNRHFPDLVPLMPTLDKDFLENPVGSLVTVRVDPWNVGRVVLIGDAAHAVVPFFGQGMNAAFEDGYNLYRMINDSIISSNHSLDFNIEQVINDFAKTRRVSTDSLADLCIEHYHDMASNTASILYLLQKKLEGLISTIFPDQFIPLYSMVTFSDLPYNIAVERAKRQDTYVIASVYVIVGCLSLIVCYYLYNMMFPRHKAKHAKTI